MTRPHQVDRRQQVSGETGYDQQYRRPPPRGRPRTRPARKHPGPPGRDDPGHACQSPRLTARPHSHVRFIGRRAAGLGRDGLQEFCILVVLLQTLAAAPAEFAVYQLVLERGFPRVSHPAGGRTWSGPDRGR